MTLGGPLGQLEVLGRVSVASNATFLAKDSQGIRWVYKPVAGERPLWDFPQHTLGRREVAAHTISTSFGFDVVPLTVWSDGPFGEGSVQLWIEGSVTDLVGLLTPEDVDDSWLPVAAGVDAEDRPVVMAHRDSPELRKICLFDLVINNSDRKVGHLIDDGGRLFGIDHGVSFSVEEKHRTVLWGFAGRPFDDDELARLADVAALPVERPEGLQMGEWEHVALRAEALLERGEYPGPSGDWPALPWPPW